MRSVHRLCSLVLLVLALVTDRICSALAAEQASGSSYVHKMSKDPWVNFPGGRVKVSTQSQLPATTIAGALFELRAGGVREPHWHDAAEWAYVINGTCIATALDEGRTHPTDTWNFTAGDVWYFPANVPHSIAGAPPTGCGFVSGFNTPNMDERDAISASGWLASLPKDVLAQVSGRICCHCCQDAFGHMICAHTHAT
jgi:oxalate decarboxylase